MENSGKTGRSNQTANCDIDESQCPLFARSGQQADLGYWPLPTQSGHRPLTGGLVKSAIVCLAFSLGHRMTLSDLASIGSLVSGMAVLASMVFLYFRLRQMNAQAQQAERNQRAVIRLGRVAQRIDLNIALMEPSAADAKTHRRMKKKQARSGFSTLPVIS